MSIPAPTEDPITADPITGQLTPISPYESNSNNNQIAILSPIDNSTNTLNSYTLSYSDNSSNNGNQVTNIYYNVNGTAHSRGHRYRLGSELYFNRDGIRQIDRIIGLEPSRDILELSQNHFEGIGSLEFQSAQNKEERKALAMSDVDIIYQQNTGQLFFNANGTDAKCGQNGGLFAVLEGAPLIGAENFVVI